MPFDRAWAQELPGAGMFGKTRSWNNLLQDHEAPEQWTVPRGGIAIAQGIHILLLYLNRSWGEEEPPPARAGARRGFVPQGSGLNVKPRVSQEPKRSHSFVWGPGAVRAATQTAPRGLQRAVRAGASSPSTGGHGWWIVQRLPAKRHPWLSSAALALALLETEPCPGDGYPCLPVTRGQCPEEQQSLVTSQRSAGVGDTWLCQRSVLATRNIFLRGA